MCTICKIDARTPDFGVEYRSGRSRRSADLGFSSAADRRRGRDESPRGTATATAHSEAHPLRRAVAPESTSSRFEEFMTPSQKELYEAFVDRFISQDPERNLDVARDRVDFHIHVHYTSSRVPLSLCRDKRDADELKDWMWRMNRLDEVDSPAGKCWGQRLPTNSSVLDGAPWPEDRVLMAHVEYLWEKRDSIRQRRLEKSRMKWEKIMEERERQRQQRLEWVQLQLLQRAGRQKGRVKRVKIYWGPGMIRDVALDSR
ncbi:hypothetical protein BDV28DRAFT_120572 [Aspergillus coremiiformis]|uniref:Uncharacterized protein n=1 Tax=Aspergillus coremiiformis TaxID=138285 RepID=A0A5N6Z524_9EURO|nr:hypothetical protein BDV28DRAFT_120572 [Aspergillus coremiiformis]